MLNSKIITDRIWFIICVNEVNETTSINQNIQRKAVYQKTKIVNQRSKHYPIKWNFGVYKTKKIEFKGNNKTKNYKPNPSEGKKFRELFDKLNEQALNVIFVKKEFKINGEITNKSSVFNIFDRQTEFPNKPLNMDFVCIICKTILNQPFEKASSDLNHHLKSQYNDGDSHKELEFYFKCKDQYKTNQDEGNWISLYHN